ncbi:hypothetical protein [Rhodococcus pyridinivorans]|uniref:hypothetical protein n=1 Tax=Rhodococcus pyridinivorans TaxID=103816 RepID=UPI002659EEB0|nr:hypothetical protein [Rhodococcus pyridinivorans]
MTASAPSDSPSTGTDSSERMPRRRWPVVLSVLGAVVVLVGVSGAWTVHEFGPRVGVYLGAPSPQRYAEIALDLMENGYYATGPEWEAQRARVRAAADGAASIEELHGPLAAAVKVAGGKHSFFLDPVKAARSSSRGKVGPLLVVVHSGKRISGGLAWKVMVDYGADEAADSDQQRVRSVGADLCRSAPECGALGLGVVCRERPLPWASERSLSVGAGCLCAAASHTWWA